MRSICWFIDLLRSVGSGWWEQAGRDFPESTFFAVSIPDMEAARKAASNSRFGEIYKQPEMRAFLDPIVARIAAAYDDCRALEPRLPAADALDHALFTGELSMCVYARGAEAEPGIVFAFKPKDTKAFERMLIPALNGKTIPAGQPVPFGNNDVPMGFFYSDGRLIVCQPMADLGTVVARAAKAPGGLGTLEATRYFQEARAAMGNSQAWIYMNPASFLQFTDARANAAGPKPSAVFNAAGFDSMGGMMLSLDFNAGEPVANMFLGLHGDPRGIMTLIGDKPVNKDVLQIAAENAPYVSAGSFHLDRIIPIIREAAETIAPNAGQGVNVVLAQAADRVHFDLQKDLFANIEPDFAIAQTQIDTGAPLSFSSGVTGMFRIKNAAKVEDCIKKAMLFFSTMIAEQKTPAFMMKLGNLSHNGTTIYYFTQTLNGSIYLAVLKDRLVWGNSLNAIKRGITQLASGTNILSNKQFQASMTRVSGKPFDAEKLPLAFAYSVDNGGGGGLLVTAMLGLSVEAGAVAGLAEAVNHGAVLPPEPNELVYLREVTSHAAGRTALNVVNSIDLNLWPDEGFFAQYRLAHASVATFGETGWSARTELPAPLVTSSASPMVVVAGVAIVAAIAIPNLLRSRMAANETAAVAACKAFCTAQDIYRRTDYNKDGVLEYAQALKGKDSLYENAPGQGDLALIDRSFANAEANTENAMPKAGYYFKVLKGQGPHAQGGARNYMANGHMTQGYAFVAYPAQYDGTGRNTFLVSHAGTIYQKDLGAQTQAIVEKMTEYDPDETWVIEE